MAWKAKTLAKTLMTVALEITFGILSAMINRFGHAKAHIVVCSSLRTSSENIVPAAFSAALTWHGTSKWKRSVPHPIPNFCRIDCLIRIEGFRPGEQNLRRFRIQWVRNATIIDRADGGTLWLFEVSDTLGTAVVRNHIDTIADSLAVAHMISLRLRIAASLKNRLVRTFRQAGSTVDTFVGNQQCHYAPSFFST
jgi:hypothetical protein